MRRLEDFGKEIDSLCVTRCQELFASGLTAPGVAEITGLEPETVVDLIHRKRQR